VRLGTRPIDVRQPAEPIDRKDVQQGQDITRISEFQLDQDQDVVVPVETPVAAPGNHISVLTGSLVLFFILVNTLKLPSYVALEWITLDTLKQSAVFALFVPIGSLLGIAMHHRIPEKPFTAVMYAGAAVAGGWLIVKVIV